MRDTDFSQLLFVHLEEREHNNVYQNLQQDTEYLEATAECYQEMNSHHSCSERSLLFGSVPHGDAVLFFPANTTGRCEISTEKSEVS